MRNSQNKHEGRYWRSAEELGMEVRRPEFSSLSTPKKHKTKSRPPAEIQRVQGPRAEVLPTSLGQGDTDVIYYEPGHHQDNGPPTIRVNHNHNHVTRHDDRERNLFLFLVTVIMSVVGALAGLSIAAGFGLPWGPSAGLGAALVALPALTFVLRVASLDPERERHVTERRRDKLQAVLERERDLMEDKRENRRIDIEAGSASAEAALAIEQVQTDQRQAEALAEQAKRDRVRIVEQAQRHARPQSVNNQLANFEPEEEEAPSDPIRAKMLETLVDLYDPDAKKVERSGLIVNGYRLPWSKRGGFTESERKQALDVLGQLESTGAPLFIYQKGKRRWALNVKRYPTLEEAIEGLDQARTRT